MGIGLAIPLFGYPISPALKGRTRSWVEAESMNALAAGDPKPLSLVIWLGELVMTSNRPGQLVRHPWEMNGSHETD